MTNNQKLPRPLKILIIDGLGGVSFGVAIDIAATGNTAYFLPESFIAKGGWHGVNILPVASLSPAYLIESISQAVNTVAPDAVLLLSQDQLYRIWEAAPDWLPLVHPALEEKFRALYLSKHAMTHYIESLGVLVPRTIEIKSSDKAEISEIIESLHLPLVVKGAQGAGGSQVRICYSDDEVFKAVAELSGITGRFPALQEFIDGCEYSALGLFDHGRPVHLWINEKTETYPPGTGPAIVVISRRDNELLEAAKLIYKGLEFTGIACTSFIRGSDGRCRFIEINPRIWGSYQFASVLGIDLFGSWCRQLRGEQLPDATSYPENRRWAKIPDYLFADPGTPFSFLRRLLNPLSLKSWAWTSPPKLVHQLRKTFWRLKSARGKSDCI